MSILETEHEELTDAGVSVVKMNDRKSAKQAGVLTFPGLTFFKAGIGNNYEGADIARKSNTITVRKNILHFKCFISIR